MTYSILMRCPTSLALGIAVQSSFPGAGALVPSGRYNAGIVASQGFTSKSGQAAVLGSMRSGLNPELSLERALRDDRSARERQYAVIAPNGDVATFTGDALAGGAGYSGVETAPGAVAIGNALSGPQVLSAMLETALQKDAPLEQRLIDALRAGARAGGEIRGQQSAGLLVVAEGRGYGGDNDRFIELSVFDHDSPIEELARIEKLHRLSYRGSEPGRVVAIDEDTASWLRRLLDGQRISPLEPRSSGPWSERDADRLNRFLGYENYDNRRHEGIQIDLDVLADLKARFSI